MNRLRPVLLAGMFSASLACSSGDEGGAGADGSAGDGGTAADATVETGTTLPVGMDAAVAAETPVGGQGGAPGRDAGRPDSAQPGADAGGPGGDAGSSGGDAAPIAGAYQKRPDMPGPANDKPIILAPKAMDALAHSMFVDGAGNVIVGVHYAGPVQSETAFAKYDPALNLVWQKPTLLPGAMPGPFQQHLQHVRLAGTAAGDIYVIGQAPYNMAIVPTETTKGNRDAFVARYSAAGDLAWLRQFGSAGDELTTRLLASADGGVRVLGVSSGQMPQQPATSRGGPFVTQFGADGTQVWTKQLRPIDGRSYDMVPLGAASDNAGNTYLAEVEGLAKFAPDGTELWRITNPTGPKREEFVPQFRLPGVHPLGDIVFAWGGGYIKGGYSGQCLHRLSGAGAGEWFRVAAPHKEIIEPVEGVIWNGNLTEPTVAVASADAIYIGGQFNHFYNNGSQLRKSHNSGFVARYDLEGQQVWFQLFEAAVAFGEEAVKPVDIALDPQGNLVVAANNARRYHLFRLKAADGAVMP